mgnify:CR=1 FL=1
MPIMTNIRGSELKPIPMNDKKNCGNCANKKYKTLCRSCFEMKNYEAMEKEGEK